MIRGNEDNGAKRGRTTAATAVLVAVWAVSLASGCPRYEDAKSGTYRQVEFDGTATGPAVKVDLFRFGTHARAVLRYFERNEVTRDRFGEQTFCTWTWENEFDEESGEFHLPVQRSSRISDGRLNGRMRDEALEIELVDQSNGETLLEEMRLEKVDSSPEPECDMVGDYLIRPTFNLHQTRVNRMPEEVDYQIENPVFSVQWVGVQAQRDSESSSQFLAAINAQGPTTRLGDARFVEDENALQGVLSLPLPPPPDKILVHSGSTRFALGHFVVVDDTESQGRFQWDVDTEPIVASALQRGRRPEGPPRANGTGKAILFVEDELRDLDDALLERIDAEDREVNSREAHFYIVDVDVDFLTDEVLEVTLPPTSRDRSIPMMVTDQYIGADGARLPRLFPYATNP